MVGILISFRLRWPIFRCDLLVVGSVNNPYIWPNYNISQTFRLPWNKGISITKPPFGGPGRVFGRYNLEHDWWLVTTRPTSWSWQFAQTPRNAIEFLPLLWYDLLSIGGFLAQKNKHTGHEAWSFFFETCQKYNEGGTNRRRCVGGFQENKFVVCFGHLKSDEGGLGHINEFVTYSFFEDGRFSRKNTWELGWWLPSFLTNPRKHSWENASPNHVQHPPLFSECGRMDPLSSSARHLGHLHFPAMFVMRQFIES